MAVSAVYLRRRVAIPGRRSRSTPLPSDFRPTCISRTAKCFRPSRSIQRDAIDFGRRPGRDGLRHHPGGGLRAERRRNARAVAPQYTRVLVDTPLARVSPDSGLCRRLLSVGQQLEAHRPPRRATLWRRAASEPEPFPEFTQPIVRLDFDRMDDDDNRLFGVTAQIAWTPKPSYQLTLRTPL